MISDVLSDAVHEIDSYLASPLYDDWYGGRWREHILAVRDQMDGLRAALGAGQVPERT